MNLFCELVRLLRVPQSNILQMLVQVVLDKPSGLQVSPSPHVTACSFCTTERRPLIFKAIAQVLPGGRFHHRCVLTLLQQYYATIDGGTPTPLHRLGRGTSGK